MPYNFLTRQYEFPEQPDKLTNPAAVAAEGQRIRDSIAAGTYGNQPELAKAAAAGTPQITVAPNSGTGIEGNFGASGQPFEQASWNTDPWQQREDLSLDVLRTTAAKHKFDLEQAQLNAPLESRLLQARADATGAHQAFIEAQDAAALEHTTGFLNTLAHPNAPSPSDPGYERYVLSALIKNPRFAHSAGGREILKELSKTHDTHLSIEDLKKLIPTGYEAKTFEIGAGKQSHVTVSKIGGDAKAIAAELKNGYGLTQGQIENPTFVQVGDLGADGRTLTPTHTGSTVHVKRGDGTMATMSTEEYERFGGKYSPETAAARAATAAGGVATTAVNVPADRKARAMQALNDPDASDSARAAARKILSQ